VYFGVFVVPMNGSMIYVSCVLTRHGQPTSGSNSMLAMSVSGIGSNNEQLHCSLWWGETSVWDYYVSILI
jgi:hypothetical protein